MSSSAKTITARVPREIRDQGDAALKRIDSTVTDLVNAAFDYVIKTGKLPAANEQLNEKKKTVRRFTPKQKEAFEQFVEATSLIVAPQFMDMDAKDIKMMRLADKYGVE